MGANYIKQAQLAAGHCKAEGLSQGKWGWRIAFPSFRLKLWCKCHAGEAGLKELLPETPAQKKSSGCSPGGLNILPVFLPFS